MEGKIVNFRFNVRSTVDTIVEQGAILARKEVGVPENLFPRLAEDAINEAPTKLLWERFWNYTKKLIKNTKKG